MIAAYLHGFKILACISTLAVNTPALGCARGSIHPCVRACVHSSTPVLPPPELLSHPPTHPHPHPHTPTPTPTRTYPRARTRARAHTHTCMHLSPQPPTPTQSPTAPRRSSRSSDRVTPRARRQAQHPSPGETAASLGPQLGTHRNADSSLPPPKHCAVKLAARIP